MQDKILNWTKLNSHYLNYFKALEFVSLLSGLHPKISLEDGVGVNVYGCLLFGLL